MNQRCAKLLIFINLFGTGCTVTPEDRWYEKPGEEWKQGMVWYPDEHELEGQEHTIVLDNAGCQDLPTA